MPSFHGDESLAFSPGPATTASGDGWWIWNSDQWVKEQRALDAAGINWVVDEESARAGVLRLSLIYPPLAALGPEPIALTAVYPDSYPFFPPLVEAPQLDLTHHQNPFQRNLCLLARGASLWRPATDTLATLLTSQLERLITAARTDDTSIMSELEERVPEPITYFYPYVRTSAVLLATDPSSGRIPLDATHGSFVLGLEELPRPDAPPALRGALLSLHDSNGRALFEAPVALIARYSKRPRLTGLWSRVDRAVIAPTADSAALHVYEASKQADPKQRDPDPLELGNGFRLRVRAILFPQERLWRGEADHVGDGWAFAVRMYRINPGSSGGMPAIAGRGARGRVNRKAAQPGLGKAYEPVMYLARPHRYALADLIQRAPELTSLSAHSVAIFGLGCLGAPSALEFAKATVGGLRLLDDDQVDAATTLRWPIGLGAVGLPKVDAVRILVERDYPYVRVEASFPHRLGDVRNLSAEQLQSGEFPSEQHVLAAMLDGASMIYDACAERSVQYLLSQIARARALPYVSVQGTKGAWGGMVVCIDPSRTEGCWGCLQHWLGAEGDGGIGQTPEDTSGGDVPVEGCAERTYAGANFDLAEVAMMGVRTAIGLLANVGVSGNEHPAVARYPRSSWDVATLALRNEAGSLIAPQWQTHVLRRYPSCALCGGGCGDQA